MSLIDWGYTQEAIDEIIRQFNSDSGKWCPRCRAGPDRCSCPWW